MRTECRVPAKLILSGEHAVVFGKPALSLAINLYGYAQFEFTPANVPQIELSLSDFNHHQAWSFQQAWDQAMDIESRYLTYQQAALSIRQVCQSVFDIPLLVLFHFEQRYGLKSGHWRIGYRSNIWQGRGLGSSAALIVSLLAGLFKLHQIDDKSALFELSRLIESRQHGQSSGLDPATLIQGGVIRFQSGQYQSIETPNHQAWLIDTGMPESTTGECVDHVKQHYGSNVALWQKFGECTDAIHQAWCASDTSGLITAIRQNQNLLTQIQVVPPGVQAFIQQLESETQGAAKLCGAGSLVGDAGGVLMLVSQSSPQSLCERYGFPFQAIQTDPQGVQCEVA